MKIEHYTNSCTITYTKNELAFIDSLPEECRKNIFRGLAVPEDYGYKPECTYFRIDSTRVEGTQLSRNDFIKKFKELETLLMDDTKSYYVIYEEENAFPWSVGQYKEIFWCIPTSEITFRHDPEGGWQLVGRVTLCEDDEGGLMPDTDDTDAAYDTYRKFLDCLGSYIIYHPLSDENSFKLLKMLKEHTNSTSSQSDREHRAAALITYLCDQWGAFTESVLNETFKYMNVTAFVLDSVQKFCK